MFSPDCGSAALMLSILTDSAGLVAAPVSRPRSSVAPGRQLPQVRDRYIDLVNLVEITHIGGTHHLDRRVRDALGVQSSASVESLGTLTSRFHLRICGRVMGPL